MRVAPQRGVASCDALPLPDSLPAPLLGDAPALREARRRLALVAPAETTVLLLGETGSGKGAAAAWLHARSARAAGPFVHVDCAALAPGVVESELFGHERGAFTGALAPRRGRFELAQSGVLFLDEVGELDLPLQAKLLRALEDRRFERVGGQRTLALDARVVAATHRDLAAAVREGRFRRDLYFRLCVFAIALPPLRARLDDLPALVAALLPGLARRVGIAPPAARADFLAALAAHAWPGNVRELANVLERALLLSEGGPLDAAAACAALADAACHPVEPTDVASASPDAAWGRPPVPAGPVGGPARYAGAHALAPAGAPPAVLRAPGADETPERIATVLRATGGNVSRAARRLGVARSTLRWQIERHGLHDLVPRD